MDTPGAFAIQLLKEKIAIPALSGEEAAAAGYLEAQLVKAGVAPFRIGHNVCACSPKNRDGQKLLMLNSHIDTVKPSAGYTFNPFEPFEKDGKLFGLGSNDAGASLAALVESFIFLCTVDLPFNLLLVLSCEEENSGPNGMKLVTQQIKNIDCAIVGEPTSMKVAVAERGLLVIDGTAHGVAGHAARDGGVNALYVAVDDIAVIRNYAFNHISPLMGAVKKTVTMINGGVQHNVVPAECRFVIDVRPNECYTNREILADLQAAVKSKLNARSLDNKCSFTPAGHPLWRCAEQLGFDACVSPTTSDWMRLDVPAIKMGPGASERSHSADEFVYLDEIRQGVKDYIRFITSLNNG
ncbi:MAG: M20/M25/M40 family metallo-hydrolase [Prevotellaceae bacterium]|jgi:acetylornithine deacetylase|nr:M20/M25/M40 family metallo-hydrolase [Prevotellaceae bacterium]